MICGKRVHYFLWSGGTTGSDPGPEYRCQCGLTKRGDADPIAALTDELTSARAALARAEQANGDLVRAIRLARNRDYEGGPCWCWSADTDAGYRHDSSCAELRRLLAAATTTGQPVAGQEHHP